jgi:hypothetical protein
MLESLSTLTDLFTRPDFQAGIVAGIVGLAALYWVSRTTDAPSWWGVVHTLAVVGAVTFMIGRHLAVTAGLLALGAGGWLLDRDDTARNRLPGWTAIVAGAVLIGLRGGLADLRWLPVTAPIAILIAGVCAWKWSRRFSPGLLGPMIAITAFGVWVTVPETEHARALLGVSIPLALATLAPIRARLSGAGAFALAGVLVWVVAIGGGARPGSIIGGWASLGAIAILPLVRPPASALVERRPGATLAFHAVFVLISARVIGLWESAVIATGAVLVVAFAALVAVGSLARLPRPQWVGPHGPE